MTTTPLYFDNHATTPLDPRVLEAMMPYLTDVFGNAESVQHSFGWKAKAGVEKARGEVAALLGAAANEIVFTSGATESIHLAVLGHLETLTEKTHLITSNAEHKATLEVYACAAKQGHDVTILPVDRLGQVSRQQVLAALKPNTSLVSLLHGNNEIGTLNPIGEIGAELRDRGVLFHVDAAQTAGKIPVDVRAMKIDLLSISAHKLYGPKGVGALFVRRDSSPVHLKPLMVGGGQERGLRAGTPNVPGIVGLGRCCSVAQEVMVGEMKRISILRDRLIRAAIEDIGGIELNGHPTERLCNNASLTIHGVDGDQLLVKLSDVAYSSASACSSGGVSHVLKAIGQTTSDPLVTTVRFGLGRFTTDQEVDALISRLKSTIENARAVSKTYELPLNTVSKI